MHCFISFYSRTEVCQPSHAPSMFMFIFPHNMSNNLKELTAERCKSGSLSTSRFLGETVPLFEASSHGNREPWRTWPTYVLYVHKHVAIVCYCQSACRGTGCWMGLSVIVRTAVPWAAFSGFEKLSMSCVNSGCLSHGDEQLCFISNFRCKHIGYYYTVNQSNVLQYVISDKISTSTPTNLCGKKKKKEKKAFWLTCRILHYFYFFLNDCLQAFTSFSA